MINIIVTILAPVEANRSKMQPLLKELVAASQKENGNVYYEYYNHPTDPSRMAIIEVWQNPDVLKVHEATVHFTTLLPQIVKLAEKVELKKFRSEPMAD